MPNFAILGIAKQKGGSVALSGRHNDRAMAVPNADPERSHLNRVLHGEDTNVRQLVTETINGHGGKPRKDAVEAIEFLCKASPQFFNEKEPAKRQEKIDRFVEQAMLFLLDERSGGRLVKAVLHLDEHTPHIHAHKVPLDPEGKLNCKHYLGGRDKMEAMHDLYAEYMAPLGLERGRRRSRATHERIEDFYRSINQDVRLEVDHEEIPDPPKVMITEEARKKYKEKLIRAVLKQLEEPHKVMRDQAMLARHERGQREEAERKAEERVAAVEHAAAEKIKAVERDGAERFDNLHRSALHLVEENRGLHRDKETLRVERNQLHESLLKMTREKLDFQMQARDYHDRLTDIPMPEVMEKLGYEGARHGEALVYRGDRNEVAMLIEQQKAFDHQRELICKNSLDLVVHMRRHNEGVEGFTHSHALEWLREEFGEKRAAGAAVAHREHSVLDLFERGREERERTRSLVHERGDDPWRGPQGRAEDRDRVHHDRGGPERGGGGGFER
jgi:hypothetical protein